MPEITITAFLQAAFQNNAFLITASISAAGGEGILQAEASSEVLKDYFTTNDTYLGLWYGTTVPTSGMTLLDDKVINGDWETGDTSGWNSWFNNVPGASGTFTVVSMSPYQGTYNALVTISSPGAVANDIQMSQSSISIISGRQYVVRFAAKAVGARTIEITITDASPPYTNYGLSQTINLTTSWQIFETTFTANATDVDTRLYFLLGGDNNDVEFDEISLTPDIFEEELSASDYNRILIPKEDWVSEQEERTIYTNRKYSFNSLIQDYNISGYFITTTNDSTGELLEFTKFSRDRILKADEYLHIRPSFKIFGAAVDPSFLDTIVIEYIANGDYMAGYPEIIPAVGKVTYIISQGEITVSYL